MNTSSGVRRFAYAIHTVHNSNIPAAVMFCHEKKSHPCGFIHHDPGPDRNGHQ